MDNKFLLALKSRTTWMVVLLFLSGGLSNITGFIPENIMMMIQTVLGGLIVYFKVNTRTDYRD